MKVIETKLPGALIIEPQVFDDNRGFFKRPFRYNAIEKQVSSMILYKITTRDHKKTFWGVCILTDSSDVNYKSTDFYDAFDEGGVI